MDRPSAALGLLVFCLLLAMGAVFRKGLSFFTAILLLSASVAGAASFLITAGTVSKDISAFSGYPLYVEGTVVEEPLRAEDNITYYLQVGTVETGEGRFPFSGKFLIKVYGKDQEPYWFGEKLRLRGVIEQAEGRRNPGGFDYRFYLRTVGICGVMYLQPYQVGSLGSGEVNSLINSALTLRARLVKGLEAGLPSPQAELLSAILFGQRRRLPETVQENFKQSGVSHLLAVSGLHVGLVAALFLGFCRRIKIKGRLPLAVAVLIIFGYAYLTGMRPPALRAAVMFSTASGALLLDRENDLSTAISVSALLTLFLNPFHLYSAGFQLSYAATLAIIYARPLLMDLLGRLKTPLFLRSLLAVTTAAQLGVLPICIAHFQHVPLGALWFNVLLLPVMPLVVGLGLATALLGLVFPALASLLFPGMRLLLEYMLMVTGLSRFAGFYIPTHVPSPLIWISYYVVFSLVLIYYYRRPDFSSFKPWPKFKPFLRRPFYPTAAGLILVTGLIWGSLLLPNSRQQGLTVTFIDVGQGASALVESGRGRILIDCGGDMKFTGEDPGKIGEQVLLPFLRSRGIRSLDLVIITHPHEDHFGGLRPLLESIPVKSIWISPQPGSSPYYEEALQEACSRGIPVTKVREGGRGDGFGLTLDVLGPPRVLYTGTGSDENNNSIVLRLLHSRTEFLFCGDIEQVAVEDLLRRQRANLNAEVLLIPHHGGLLPNLPQLIKAVDPRLAVIQVGKNSFGHPHPTTVEILQREKVLTFRNDLHGAIIVNVKKSGPAINTMLTEKLPASGW